jgi:hypothetical protein
MPYYEFVQFLIVLAMSQIKLLMQETIGLKVITRCADTLLFKSFVMHIKLMPMQSFKFLCRTTYRQCAFTCRLLCVAPLHSKGD